MKKLLLVFGLITFLVIGATAQTYTVADVQVDAVETLYSSPITFGDANVVVLQAVCTEDGGTSDGSILVQENVVGTTWVTHGSADTLTITSGAIKLWKFYKQPTLAGQEDMPPRFRLAITGTASDTTTVAIDYTKK